MQILIAIIMLNLRPADFNNMRIFFLISELLNFYFKFLFCKWHRNVKLLDLRILR